MSKIVEQKVESFYGGVIDSTRKDSTSEFALTKHFDIFTDPFKLIPYRSFEIDANDGSTSTGMYQYVVRDFIYASASDKLYGLGRDGSGFTKIVYKAASSTGNWTVPGSSTGNGDVKNGCLVEYKDYLWGFQGTTQIWRWGLLSGSPSIANSQSATGVATTSVANGLVFQDYLYLPYNNKIWRATDASTYSDAYLTLPTNFKITSLTAYGKYIAIACAPISTFNGISTVFLWDGTATDIQESIGWGEGELRVLETIEGMLVGVTDRYLNVSSGAGRGSMIVQVYSGGSPQIVKEIFTQALTGKSIPISKATKNNRLFWAAKIMTNSAGTTYNEGIWSFGRKNANYPYTMTLDMIDENINTSGIQGFGAAANFFFIGHSGASGKIDKTDDTVAYTFTSIYESQIFDAGDVDSDKTLLSLKVSFASLPTSGNLTAKFRVDGATSWTTIGSDTTVGDISRTFVNIESSGDAFASGREYEFQLSSTGGVEITGFKALFRINDTPS